MAALARTFTATYNAFVEDNLASISDKGALQLLFDNLFLTKILGDALSDQDEMLDVVAKEIGPRQQSALVNKLRSMVGCFVLTPPRVSFTYGKVLFRLTRSI